MALGEKLKVAMQAWVETQLSKKANLDGHRYAISSGQELAQLCQTGSAFSFSHVGADAAGLPADGINGFAVRGQDGRFVTLWASKVDSDRTWIGRFFNGDFIGWAPLATATPPQELALPLAAGVVDAGGIFRNEYRIKQDGELVFELGVNPAGGGYIVEGTHAATLPVGYRPDKEVVREVHYVKGGFPNGNGHLHIHATGAMILAAVPPNSEYAWCNDSFWASTGARL